MRSVCSVLPVEKPRMVASAGDPVEVLDLVERGVDVIDGDYPATLTQFEYVAAFAVQGPGAAAPAGGDALAGLYPGGDRMKFNARDRRFETDARPLVPGCDCYTCRTHTRAYVLHLLNVHEMLGPVLLQAHNLHHYLTFFSNIRRAIAAGTFAEYKAWFLAENNVDAVPEVVPVDPAVHGAAGGDGDDGES